MTINTVTGPIAADALGLTLFHEHLVAGPPGRELIDTNFFDLGLAVARATGYLERAKAEGLRTLVDCSPIDLGRHVELMRAASEATGVQVVCATGLYNQRLGQPAYFKAMSADTQAEQFAREVQSGVRDTGIRAGILKVATSTGDRIRFHEEKTLRAVARAQKATGVPIVTHTDAGRHAMQQVEVLREEGANLAHVVVGHLDQCDADFAESILRTGVYIGIDRIGHMWLTADEKRAELLAELVRRGWGERILIAHDQACCAADDASHDHNPETHAWRREHAYSYIFTHFLPMAEAAGLPRETVLRMMRENVAAWFGG